MTLLGAPATLTPPWPAAASLHNGAPMPWRDAAAAGAETNGPRPAAAFEGFAAGWLGMLPVRC